MEQQDFEAEVTPFVVEAGALTPCPNHEDVLIHQGDDDAERHAYALVTKAWQDGRLSGTREDAMAAVKAALDNSYHFGCTHPYCADNDD